jgi:hypothetical protein
VTYVHAASDLYHRPPAMGSVLSRTMQKLNGNAPLKIVFAGDSVTQGYAASGKVGYAPFAPDYPGMTVDGLKLKFNNPNVTFVNTAIGGTTSDWEESNYTLYNTIKKHDPDLVILNYGANDSNYNSVGYTDQHFYRCMKGQIDYVRQNLPNCEILLVSSLCGNYLLWHEERYQHHVAILHQLAEEYKDQGVGVCDVQAIQHEMFGQGKTFVDFICDNIVHPNDMGMRLIAQSIIDCLRFPTVRSMLRTPSKR